MMRLAEIQRHISSMDELQDIVGAMRSLAGMRMQEALRALPGVRGYAEAMEAAIGDALLLMRRDEADDNARSGARALVLCMAEHGFVGGFDERLLEAAQAAREPGDRLFVLGSHGAQRMIEHGHELAWARPTASRLAGAPHAVDALAQELYGRIASGEIARVDVMFGRYRQGGQSSIERNRVLPVELAVPAAESTRLPPLHNMAPRALLEKLIAEYVFARLAEAAVESIASENAARYSAMSAAHDNVGKKLSGLQASAREARQTEITSELMDLVTGEEATSAKAHRPSSNPGA
jgi:F-type H+-transporting ATPase subunit gamma